MCTSWSIVTCTCTHKRVIAICRSSERDRLPQQPATVCVWWRRLQDQGSYSGAWTPIGQGEIPIIIGSVLVSGIQYKLLLGTNM